jgi:hypothetical protein
MIASKIVCDDTYSNQSWCVVAQKMFTLKEMNQMEREMCGYLEWNLVSGAHTSRGWYYEGDWSDEMGLLHSRTPRLARLMLSKLDSRRITRAWLTTLERPPSRLNNRLNNWSSFKLRLRGINSSTPALTNRLNDRRRLVSDP